MKWLLAVALALLLVAVCVVYLRRERPPARLPQAPAAAAPAAKPVRPPRPASPPSLIDITGPLKDRALVSWVLPEYPAWAEVQGITAKVSIKIWVTPAGEVKSFMQPQSMATDQRFETLATDAIRQWRFAEKSNALGDQWGVVTMRFSLAMAEQVRPEVNFSGMRLGKSALSGAWECVKEWVGDANRRLVYICKKRR